MQDLCPVRHLFEITFFTSWKIHFLFLTETWFGINEISPLVELAPANCDFISFRKWDEVEKL